MPRRRSSAHRYVERRKGDAFRSIVTILISSCLVASLVSLFSCFALYRHRLAKFAGSSYVEDEWGFGQILAVLTWVPTIVDFLVVWKGSFDTLIVRKQL